MRTMRPCIETFASLGATFVSRPRSRSTYFIVLTTTRA
jgi:hypothetical protein